MEPPSPRPSPNPDSVASKLLSMNMLIDTGLVAHKVLIDSEGGLGRSIGHQLIHDLLLTAADSIGLFSISLVLRKGDFVIWIITSLVTLWGSDISVAGSPRTVHVMLARLDLIGLASVRSSKVSSSHQAFVSPVVPGHSRISSIATVAASEAAAEQVLSRDVLRELALAVNAHPV